MPALQGEQVSRLQQESRNIRNICILAHVDHGKTTVADALVASNGIISQRMAGKLRYMDSRDDEQRRGITMKSSAISLLYNHPERGDHLINLIDSPGHIDFSTEVSTAVRLCDGALVIVDVVEGVCPQTVGALRQAWQEGLRPVLILNKMDRLCVELKFTPHEAYTHLVRVLEQVNAVMGELFASDVMYKASASSEEEKKSSTDGASSQGDIQKEEQFDWSSGLEDTDDSDLYFSPDQGNVVFASAYDGWGFDVAQFAHLYATKLGLSERVLLKTIWGDYYLNNKEKRIHKGALAKGKKPIFVQFVLEQIWAIYESICEKRDKARTEKIVKALGLRESARDTKHNDTRVQLQSVMGQWLPLAATTLKMVVQCLPGPRELSEERVQKLMTSGGRDFTSLPPQSRDLKADFLTCSAGDDAPVIVFVSKMFAVDPAVLPENKPRQMTDEEREAKRAETLKKLKEREEMTTTAENGSISIPLSSAVKLPESTEEKPTEQVFLAFARVYSGTVKTGSRLFVLGPRHDPAEALEKLSSATSVYEVVKELPHVTEVTVGQLYLLMGRELQLLPSVPAGCVFGMRGVEAAVLKSATISNELACPSFCPLYLDAAPIVKVAVEPVNPGDLAAVSRGLELLRQADPCVETSIEESGELVLAVAGEVHLEKCVKDLNELFARVELSVSAPIVPFRETIVPPPQIDMVSENMVTRRELPQHLKEDPEVLGTGLVRIKTPDGRCALTLRALPLPPEVTQLLLDEHETLVHVDRCSLLQQDSRRGVVGSGVRTKVEELQRRLSEIFERSGKHWRGAGAKIWAVGPHRTGSCVLFNKVPDYERPTVFELVQYEALEGERRKAMLSRLRRLDASVAYGFQLATQAGPLCAEPMSGVGYFVEEWDITARDSVTESQHPESPTSKNDSGSESESETDSDSAAEPVEPNSPQRPSRKRAYGPLSGQIMAVMKDACLKSFESSHQRLVIAMYSCTAQATAEVLGKLYAVLGRRGGRILEEELREGSATFDVQAVLPVIESFGFAEEIRKKTSGFASPQLSFSHWEILPIDPFWVPTTEEEKAHYGDKADAENAARKYMNGNRKRKGLVTDTQLVVHAEKQRTLTRNK